MRGNAEFQHEHPGQTLQPSSPPKIALGDEDGHEYESRFTAIDRRLQTNTSELKETECTNGVTKSKTPVSTQSLPPLRFDRSPCTISCLYPHSRLY